MALLLHRPRLPSCVDIFSEASAASKPDGPRFTAVPLRLACAGRPRPRRAGLDSVTSLALCTKLRQLVDARLCTVVSTIHQPQAKIFRLFTHLLLLKSGGVVFQGRASRAVEFFESIGQPVPMHENPAVRPHSKRLRSFA